MLPELYRIHLSSQLSQAQLLTLEILVWLLQVHKQVKIERRFSTFSIAHQVREPTTAHSKISYFISDVSNLNLATHS